MALKEAADYDHPVVFLEGEGAQRGYLIFGCELPYGFLKDFEIALRDGGICAAGAARGGVTPCEIAYLAEKREYACDAASEKYDV